MTAPGPFCPPDPRLVFCEGLEVVVGEEVA